MSRFIVHDTPLADLKVIERQQVGDSRGFFSRLFCADELAAAGWRKPVAQINETLTRQQGTIRGMHYQRPPHAEMKLVTCLAGEIWDVAVDLRRGSPTFLRWHAEELSAANSRAMLIPEGFAHGFQTLAANCSLLYLHSVPYAAEAEAGLNPKDPMLGITWPLEIAELSARDSRHPLLSRQFEGVAV